MLIDRTHRKWFFVSAIILAVATAAYVVYANRMPNGPRGGTVVGLIFGIIGSLMMTFAGLLAGRKQFPIAELPIPFTGKRLRLGSAQFWLRGHIWLGVLSVPMIFYHSGFAWGGLVENALWITFGIVVLSGLYGLVVQQVFPRFLTSRVPVETFVQQVPYQCTRTKILSDRLVADACGRLEVPHEPLFPVFQKIADFYKSAGKDDKGQWLNVVGDEHRSLFLDLAIYAKQNRMIRMEADFAKFLAEVYVGIDADAAPAKATPAKPSPNPPASTAADTGAPADAPPAAGKKLSPLEQMRAKAAGGGGPPGAAQASAPAKAGSPLERARAQAGAASPSSGNGDTDSAPAAASSKPMSKLEQARAAAKQASTGGTKSSPLERARQQSPAGPASGKPLSKLEQARAQAAAEKAAGADSTKAPSKPGRADAPAKSAPAKSAPAAPAPAAAAGQNAPMSAEQVEQEVGKIRDVLQNQYGYDAERADFAAEQPRKFLAPGATQPEAPKPAAAQPAAPKPAASEIPRAKRAKGRHRANISINRSMTIADLVECVELACPFCEFEVQLRDRGLLGRAARCPNCREKFLLVEPEESAEAESEPVAVAADASPLERARAQGASKRAAAGDGGKLSPLDRARAQAADRRGAAAPAASAPTADQSPTGKKSPLDRAREQAGKVDKPQAKPASPLEKMRAQAAAKGKSAEKPVKQPAMPGVAQKKPPASPKPAAKKPAGSPAAAGPIPRLDDLKAFYLGEVRPFLDFHSDVDGQLATTDLAGRMFAQMRVELPTQLHPILGELEQNCEQRRQFAIQKRIHRWLHWWLAFHIPASAALFVLFVLHVVMALRVTPWAM